jgi:hypothetical protein
MANSPEDLDRRERAATGTRIVAMNHVGSASGGNVLLAGSGK